MTTNLKTKIRFGSLILIFGSLAYAAEETPKEAKPSKMSWLNGEMFDLLGSEIATAEHKKYMAEIDLAAAKTDLQKNLAESKIAAADEKIKKLEARQEARRPFTDALEKKVTGAVADSISSSLLDPAKERDAARARKMRQEEIAAKGQMVRDLLTDKRVVMGTTLVAAGLFGSFFVFKEGTSVASKYVESLIGKPTLVQETSIKSYSARAYNSLFGAKTVRLTAGDIILDKNLKQDFVDIVKLTEQNRKLGIGFSHVLFYGPPGTGKTLGAKVIAQMSGIDYAIIAGSSFKQFAAGKDVQELDALIRWGKNAPNGLILFIDEADSALGIRRGVDQRNDDLVNFFLSNFEKTTHDKIKLVLATNHPERLDPAILSRVSKSVYVGLPKAPERQAQIKLNIEKMLLAGNANKIEADQDLMDNLGRIAAITEGFTGRDLFELTQRFKNECLLNETKHLSLAIAIKVAEDMVNSVRARELMQGVKHQTYFNPLEGV